MRRKCHQEQYVVQHVISQESGHVLGLSTNITMKRINAYMKMQSNMEIFNTIISFHQAKNNLGQAPYCAELENW